MRWRNDRGANLVEMALSMVLLLLLLAGAIDFGRAFYSYIAIRNGSREGARYASRFPHYRSGIEDAAKREIESAGIVCNGVEILITPDPATSASPGTPVSVTVTCGFDTLLGPALDALIPGATFSVLRLQDSTEMIVFGG